MQLSDLIIRETNNRTVHQLRPTYSTCMDAPLEPLDFTVPNPRRIFLCTYGTHPFPLDWLHNSHYAYIPTSVKI